MKTEISLFYFFLLQSILLDFEENRVHRSPHEKTKSTVFLARNKSINTTDVDSLCILHLVSLFYSFWEPKVHLSQKTFLVSRKENTVQIQPGCLIWLTPTLLMLPFCRHVPAARKLIYGCLCPGRLTPITGHLALLIPS